MPPDDSQPSPKISAPDGSDSASSPVPGAGGGLDRFKTDDAGSYDQLTGEFDHFSEKFSAPLADRMIQMARLSAAERVLDVGTGTGIVAWRAAGKVGPAGRVVGIDLSDGMLAAARAKALRLGLGGQVEFHKMDAEALALADGSCDVVLSLFALLHFPNPLTALKEMRRVVRPGGRLVLAVGSAAPRLTLGGWIHRFSRLPGFIRQLRGNELSAPTFLDRLVSQRLPPLEGPEQSALASQGVNRAGKVPRLIGQAGFELVKTFWEGHLGELEDPADFWKLQRTYSSFSRKRLNSAPADQAQAVHQEFIETCRRVRSQGGRLVYPYAAFFVVARRPALPR